MQEAERAEPVVDRDDDDVAVRRELRAVVPGRVARAPDERAAVDPHHHRAGARRRTPGVHTLRYRLSSLYGGLLARPAASSARTRSAPTARENAVASRTPSHDSSRCGGLPAQRADRRRRVRDAPEHVHAVAFEAFDLPAAGRHDRHGGQDYRRLQAGEVGLPLLQEGGDRLHVGGLADHPGERAVLARPGGAHRVDATLDHELAWSRSATRPASWRCAGRDPS